MLRRRKEFPWIDCAQLLKCSLAHCQYAFLNSLYAFRQTNHRNICSYNQLLALITTKRFGLVDLTKGTAASKRRRDHYITYKTSLII